jgi:hypothetical protein
MSITSGSTPSKMSKNPAIKGLQEAWMLSKIPLSQVVEAGVPRATAYRILVYGADNSDALTVLMIANVIGFTMSYIPLSEEEHQKALARVKREARRRELEHEAAAGNAGD